MTTPRIPDSITVTRTIPLMGEPKVEVCIDGEPLPYAVSGFEPISTEVAHGQNPGVRLTLAAYSVQLTDVFEREAPVDEDEDQA